YHTPIGVRKSKSVLRKLGVKRRKKLSPDADILYEQLKFIKRSERQVKKRNMTLRQKLQMLEKRPPLWNSLNQSTLNFIECQRRNQKLKPKGRRFTVQDKILALSIFKQSGRCYRYLSKIFSLPSKRTLVALLGKIPFKAGTNRHVFDQLKKTVTRMRPRDTYCTLMFDEISLDPGLQYNPKDDCIDGIVDFGGNERTATFADHALVFMLKGVNKKWKQPICFTFCENATPTTHLVRLIKNVVRCVRQVGLHIVATISDQGTTNVAAINNLINDTRAYCLRNGIDNRYQGYLIDGQEIIHLYDPPHLLKGVRNGLLTKDLHFTQEGKQKVASWSHVIDIYRIDRQMGKFSQFTKLTDEHVLPERIRKMKVRNCSQVFSNTVATAMKVRAMVSNELSPSSQFYVNPKASDTADLLLFFDILFDSVNGSLSNPPPGKNLRGPLTRKSKHLCTWQNALNILSTMYFKSPSDTKTLISPSIKNWAFTIKGLICIWEKLSKAGFTSLSTRAFNQDPLENFFSCIRSQGGQNSNPTCSLFISYFKSLIVNNLVSPHSIGSNCEEDQSVGVLDPLRSFITDDLPSDGTEEVQNVPLPVFPQDPVSHTSCDTDTDDLATPYVAGFILHKIFLKLECSACRNLMMTEDDLFRNKLIKLRQFSNCRLKHPSTQFSKALERITNLVFKVLPLYISSFNLKQKIFDYISGIDLTLIFCTEHRDTLKKTFLDICINVLIYHYVRRINRILNGKDLRHKDIDILTQKAFQKYSRKLHKRK
ncbi:unnamed protein product, partial [Callosobruchus maculatus]